MQADACLAKCAVVVAVTPGVEKCLRMHHNLFASSFYIPHVEPVFMCCYICKTVAASWCGIHVFGLACCVQRAMVNSCSYTMMNKLEGVFQVVNWSQLTVVC